VQRALISLTKKSVPFERIDVDLGEQAGLIQGDLPDRQDDGLEGRRPLKLRSPIPLSTPRPDPLPPASARGPLVPGNRGTDMVWANAFACSGDFLLRLAGCQGKNLIVEVRRAAAAAS
jgi:hypothetical protein